MQGFEWFDWITHPVQWINDHLDRFLRLPARWDTLYQQAGDVFRSEATKRFNGPEATRWVQSEREVKALEIMRDIDVMRREHAKTLSRLDVRDSSALSGLVVVAVIVVSAAAVVITIASLFRRTTAAEEAVQYLVSVGAPPDDIMQAVRATAQEKATGIDKVVGEIGGILKLGLLAAITLAIVPQFAARRR